MKKRRKKKQRWKKKIKKKEEKQKSYIKLYFSVCACVCVCGYSDVCFQFDSVFSVKHAACWQDVFVSRVCMLQAAAMALHHLVGRGRYSGLDNCASVSKFIFDGVFFCSLHKFNTCFGLLSLCFALICFICCKK